MNIVIHDSSSERNPMEELWVAATLGAAIRHFGSNVGRVEVELERAGSASGSMDGYTCRIELETASGPVSIERPGSSRADAFLQAAHRVERMLFDHLFAREVFGRQTSNPTLGNLAA